jgi:hypothetical protein
MLDELSLLHIEKYKDIFYFVSFRIPTAFKVELRPKIESKQIPRYSPRLKSF